MFQSRRKANFYRNVGILSAIPVPLFLFLWIASASIPLIFLAFVFLIISATLFSNYTTWSIGAEGEERVAKQLMLLGDRYRVIHDVVLPGMPGNIDHVVLGPNGIFVLETKNHKGFISCNGDSWRQLKIGRRGTNYFGKIGSPSRQIKKNAVLLSNFIKNRFQLRLYISGLVVFTNEDAKLNLNYPTVAVAKLQRICEEIRNINADTLNEAKLEELEKTLETYSCFS